MKSETEIVVFFPWHWTREMILSWADEREFFRGKKIDLQKSKLPPPRYHLPTASQLALGA